MEPNRGSDSCLLSYIGDSDSHYSLYICSNGNLSYIGDMDLLYIMWSLCYLYGLM